MKLKSHVFFYKTSCEHELTEHCPQVIEPGSPPRTNPNHPTVSSLVSRGPQSLVSHGCLTTLLSQCTLCLHLLCTSLSWTHHSPLAMYSHAISFHVWLQTRPVKQSFASIEDGSRTVVTLVMKKLPCYHAAGVQLWEQHFLFTCLEKVLFFFFFNWIPQLLLGCG